MSVPAGDAPVTIRKHRPYVPETMEMKELTFRAIFLGLILTVAGSALTATAAAAAPGLLVHGIVAVLIGVVFLASAWTTARRRPVGVA